MKDDFGAGPHRLGRRGAIAALFGATATAAAAGSAAAAQDASVRAARSTRSPDGPTATPVFNTIASPPQAGYIYRTVCLYDFTTFDTSAERIWTFNGVYSNSPLRAAVEIPAGALLRNVEWYVSNTSGSSRSFEWSVWTPSSGIITVFNPAIVPSSSVSSPTATLVVNDSSIYGPFPAGSKIVLNGPGTSSTCVVNGARLGFSGGGLEGAMRPSSGVIYDSRETGGIFANSETRTLTAFGTDPGTSAAILLITVTNAAAAGQVRVFAAGQPTPDAASMSYAAATAASSQIIVALDSSRRFNVRPTRSCHVRVDLVGWLR